MYKGKHVHTYVTSHSAEFKDMRWRMIHTLRAERLYRLSHVPSCDSSYGFPESPCAESNANAASNTVES